MRETAEERRRRLALRYGEPNRKNGIIKWYWDDVYLHMDRRNWNPLVLRATGQQIVLTSSQRCTLGDNPLIKYNEYKFNF